jgi:hypothetical protein
MKGSKFGPNYSKNDSVNEQESGKEQGGFSRKEKKNVTIGDGRIKRTTKTIVLGDFFNGERMYLPGKEGSDFSASKFQIRRDDE